MERPSVEQLARDGEFLIASFQRVIRALPEHARGIGPMARYLDVHKGTCQRVVEGATSSRDGLHAYARFPGVSALKTWLAACRAKGVPPLTLEFAESAAARLAQTLDRYHVSQRGLLDLIAASTAGTVDGVGGGESALREDRSRVERRALNAAARRVTGEEIDAKVVVGISFPSPRKKGKLRVVAVSSLRGVKRQPYARPVSAYVVADWKKKTDIPEDLDVSVGPSHELLREFSTTGLDAVTLAGSKARVMLAIDTSGLEKAERGVDATVMFTTEEPADPRSSPGARITAGARISSPTGLLVQDVYVHRSLMPEHEPRAGCFSLVAPPGGAPDGGFDECWYERFPEDVRVTRLEGGEGVDASDRLARALAAHAMRANRLDPADFVGWRTRVDYPFWQTEYRVYLG